MKLLTNHVKAFPWSCLGRRVKVFTWRKVVSTPGITQDNCEICQINAHHQGEVKWMEALRYGNPSTRDNFQPCMHVNTPLFYVFRI